jgi:hypothetical protein
VAEPVARSLKDWPAPNPSLKRLNLHLSTIEHHTLKELLRLSLCLEFFRYDHWCQVWSELSSQWFVSSLTNSDPRQWLDGSLLMAALQQVQSTLRELNLSVDLYSNAAEDVEEFDSPLIIRFMSDALGRGNSWRRHEVRRHQGMSIVHWPGPR